MFLTAYECHGIDQHLVMTLFEHELELVTWYVDHSCLVYLIVDRNPFVVLVNSLELVSASW